MYSLFYFLHITSVIIWIGSFIAFGLLIRSLLKEGKMKDYSCMMSKINQWVNRGIHPSAFLVLVTGILMMLQFNREQLPAYLAFMEQMGSLVILLSIIFLTLQSRKIKKKLNGEELRKESSLDSLAYMYSTYMLGVASFALIVIVVVSLRFV